MGYARDDFRYTALFCEENVWWLAHDLVAAGIPAGQLEVLLFSNPAQAVVMLEQRAAARGRPVAWDYHVVLSARLGGTRQVFDLDSRLPLPTPLADYLRASFPPQSNLPAGYRVSVRLIPATAFLRRFFSDRSHMLGQVPLSAFPDYPFIQPAEGVSPITLAKYRDLAVSLDDGSRVVPLAALSEAQDGHQGGQDGAAGTPAST